MNSIASNQTLTNDVVTGTDNQPPAPPAPPGVALKVVENEKPDTTMKDTSIDQSEKTPYHKQGDNNNNNQPQAASLPPIVDQSPAASTESYVKNDELKQILEEKDKKIQDLEEKFDKLVERNKPLLQAKPELTIVRGPPLRASTPIVRRRPDVETTAPASPIPRLPLPNIPEELSTFDSMYRTSNATRTLEDSPIAQPIDRSATTLPISELNRTNDISLNPSRILVKDVTSLPEVTTQVVSPETSAENTTQVSETPTRDAASASTLLLDNTSSNNATPISNTIAEETVPDVPAEEPQLASFVDEEQERQALLNDHLTNMYAKQANTINRQGLDIKNARNIIGLDELEPHDRYDYRRIDRLQDPVSPPRPVPPNELTLPGHSDPELNSLHNLVNEITSYLDNADQQLEQAETERRDFDEQFNRDIEDVVASEPKSKRALKRQRARMRQADAKAKVSEQQDSSKVKVVEGEKSKIPVRTTRQQENYDVDRYYNRRQRRLDESAARQRQIAREENERLRRIRESRSLSRTPASPGRPGRASRSQTRRNTRNSATRSRSRSRSSSSKRL